MATNYTNDNYYVLSTKDTVPASTAGTGTLTTNPVVKTLIKVATGDPAETKTGAWIYIAAQDEVRRIVDVTEDDEFVIDNAFTVDLAADAFAFIPPTTRAREISVAVTAGTTTINGQAVAAGETVTFSKTDVETTRTRDFVNPVVVDGTLGTVKISIVK